MSTMERTAANRKVRRSIAIIGEGLTEYRYVDDMRILVPDALYAKTVKQRICRL